MVTVGVDSYVDETELQNYATKRGITIAGDKTVLLYKAMDYIETRPYKGAKTDPSQPLQFPRNGETTVPQNIKTAQIVAALLTDTGVDLLAPVGRAVKRKKVDVLETEYMDNAAESTKYTQLDLLLAPYVKAAAPTAFFYVSAEE